MIQGLLPLDGLIIFKHFSRMIKMNGNLNDMPVETPVCWLDKISPWSWSNLKIVDYDEDKFEDDYDILVYVDGSKNTKVGGAYIIQYDNEILSCNFRLSDWSSVFQAEMYSIYKSLGKLVDLKVNKKLILVICDNKGVLQAINNYFNQQPIILQLRKEIEKLSKLNNVLTLCHVKGHNGIKLNEAADGLAKEATKFIQVDFDLDMPYYSAKKKLKSDLLNSWKNEVKNLVSDWSSNFCNLDLVNIINYSTVQFISGHGLFNQYKYRFKLDDQLESPNCELCEVVDDPEHVLFNCRKYSDLRHNYLYSSGLRSKSDLIKLNDKEVASDFKKFCDSVMRLRQSRT
jgi:ribonuclease HI